MCDCSTSTKRGAEPRHQEEAGEEGGGGGRKRRSGAATTGTIDLDLLNCPVCWDPLRAPVRQCPVGHVICSPCCNKLIDPRKCYLCSRKIDFNRCYVMERIVESVQVPCSNAKYGCTVKTTYYKQEDHEKTCPHAPCFCPETGCCFAGSTQALIEHFKADHQWRFTQVKYGWSFHAEVQEGIHILYNEDGSVFLLNMAVEPFGCVVSAFCVQPHNTEPKFRCSMTFSFWKYNLHQSSDFEVPSTTLSEGIPKHCFPFVVPKSCLEEDSKISVTVTRSLKSLVSLVPTDCIS